MTKQKLKEILKLRRTAKKAEKLREKGIGVHVSNNKIKVVAQKQ